MLLLHDLPLGSDGSFVHGAVPPRILFTVELVFAFCPSRREGVSQKARLLDGAPWSFGKYQENEKAFKEVPDSTTI